MDTGQCCGYLLDEDCNVRQVIMMRYLIVVDKELLDLVFEDHDEATAYAEKLKKQSPDSEVVIFHAYTREDGDEHSDDFRAEVIKLNSNLPSIS